METVDNFPLPSKEFYEIWQDSFTDMVNKHVVNILLTGEEIKHTEYFEYRKKTRSIEFLHCGCKQSRT